MLNKFKTLRCNRCFLRTHSSSELLESSDAVHPPTRASGSIPSSGSWFPSPWLSISSVHTLPSGILSRHFVGERQTETSGRTSVIHQGPEPPLWSLTRQARSSPVTLEPSKGPQLSLHPRGEPRGLSPLRAALPLPCEGGTGQSHPSPFELWGHRPSPRAR